MADIFEEFEAEQLTVLPQRLETIILGGGTVSQTSAINQSNSNVQIGGNCIHASCNQVNNQSNIANVTQNASTPVRIHGVTYHKFHHPVYYNGKWYTWWR